MKSRGLEDLDVHARVTTLDDPGDGFRQIERISAAGTGRDHDVVIADSKKESQNDGQCCHPDGRQDDRLAG